MQHLNITDLLSTLPRDLLQPFGSFLSFFSEDENIFFPSWLTGGFILGMLFAFVCLARYCNSFVFTMQHQCIIIVSYIHVWKHDMCTDIYT